jgi:hypothetical protein
MQAGFTVLRAPSARVRHPAVDFSDRALPAKVEAYACGRMYLLRKHGFPLWFRLANIVWPLAALARDAPRHGLRTIGYRWRMFSARLANFMETPGTWVSAPNLTGENDFPRPPRGGAV